MEPNKQVVGLNLSVKCRAGAVTGVMSLEEGGRDAGVTSAVMALISTTLHKVHGIGQAIQKCQM